ncbi:MAG: dh protein [Patescibacteria group bacterium]|nr:dh protein [Patescibacteria group bacterium]
MSLKPVFYDPAITYEENFSKGPFNINNINIVKNDKNPKYSFVGHKVNSPFGIAAGILLNSNHVKHAFDMGFDVVCYKTQRSTTFPCNEYPNVVYLDVKGNLTLEKASKPIVGHSTTNKSLAEVTVTNSFGVPSKGPSFWVEDLKKALSHQGKGQLLIMSVVGTIQKGFTEQDYFDDFASTAKLAVDNGAKVIEINLSCPNVASEGVLCYTKASVIAICKKTKQAIGNVPLIAKLGYFSKLQQDTLKATIIEASPYLSAVSVINTIAAPIVDKYGNQLLPGPNRLKAGVCGKGIKWAGLDMVERINKIRQENNLNLQVIGVGGVMNTDDFIEYRQKGADLVQSATAAMWNDNLANQVKAIL